MDPLRQLVRDLIAMGVGMEAKGGQPNLLVPPPAEAMVRSNLGAIRAGRDEIVRLWAEAALEVQPKRCRECKALVYRPGEGDAGWVFCEFQSCPFRTDPAAVEFQRSPYLRQKRAESVRARRRALDPAAPD